MEIYWFKLTMLIGGTGGVQVSADVQQL